MRVVGDVYDQLDEILHFNSLW